MVGRILYSRSLAAGHSPNDQERLGARHDWIHVLAGYETTPEGELDVFAFIAASMTDERGLVLLAITLVASLVGIRLFRWDDS